MSKTRFIMRFQFWASVTRQLLTTTFIKWKSTSAVSCRSLTSTINKKSRISSRKWLIQNGEKFSSNWFRLNSVTVFINVVLASIKWNSLCVIWPASVDSKIRTIIFIKTRRFCFVNGTWLKIGRLTKYLRYRQKSVVRFCSTEIKTSFLFVYLQLQDKRN